MSLKTKSYKYESFQVFFRGCGRGSYKKVNAYLPRKMVALGIQASVVESSSHYLLDFSGEMSRLGVNPLYDLVHWLRKRDWVSNLRVERGEHAIVKQSWK